MKNAVRLAALFALAASGVALAACSSTTTTGDGGTAPSSTTTATTTTTTTGTSTGTTTTTTPADGGGGGTSPGPDLNGCKNYVDRTADSASREITWGFPVSTTPEACMKIKVGQSVTWKGDLGIHPIGPKGGDANSPIKSQASNAFPAAGTFGYVCTNHSTMTGVVLVVP